MTSNKHIHYPIRVLHVVTTMNHGGLETMLMNYYRHIDHNLVQFDFLVHRDSESDYDQEILSLGGQIYHLPRLNPFSIHYHKELDSFFKNHPEYQIVHVHQDCMSSIALKAAYRNHVPVRIAHSHNANQDKNIKYLIKRYFMRSIPQYATHLFACGEEAGKWMFNGKNFIVLNNAIDTQHFVYDMNKRSLVRGKLGVTDDFIIGHVGRFNKQKNHDFLIDIFNEVHKIINNSKLLLVGTGNLKDRIRKRVTELNLTDDVIFLGNRNDVNDLMQAMDIFVFPSHYEGLPVTLVEAQASGLPIIKSNYVPDQCIMTPNVYTLSLSDSSKEWANEIIKMMKEYKRTDTSHYIIENKYDVSANAKWLEKFYIGEVEKYGI